MIDQLERVRVALAGSYAVERELGAGGMATVYLAQDLKHDRRVAIKVLHDELAASLGSERFLREIRITAKLSHPHILPLYDSGVADGVLYYVMPLVEGESLADRMVREKQLPLRDAVQIAREVAEALGYAHSLGLVHRDIKPGNILLSGGHAVIADFGIARAVDEAGAEKLTQSGMSVGTPAYMSPEQVAGDPNVDGRSDLYSLGCVLYEMLVGQPPFTGPTPLAIMARHSMDHVPSPVIQRDAIPDELEDVVMTALAKVPADRYRTGAELSEALGTVDLQTAAHRRPSVAARRASTGVRPRLPAARPRWLVPAIAAGAVVVALGAWLALGGGGAGAPATGGFDLRRIAVLYFEDLSRDGALRHVADGLTEDLIAQLERVRGLDVISRNGVAPFRGTGTPRDAVARALGAGTLVVGSVEAGEGGRVRVTTRLVDGTSGADVGRRASFTVPTAALLSAGDSVARDVAATLREWLGQEVALRERRSATASVAAWTLLQRAEKARKDAAAAARAGRADTAVALLAHADSLLAAAERDDRRWLDPVLERGWVARQRAGFESGAAATWLEQGLAHARRALEREPTRPDALALRGTLRYELYGVREATDPRGAATLLRDAQADLEAAVAADPALADANITLSYLYYDTKDVPGAQVAARRGYEEDPYLTRADAVLGRLFWSHLDLEQFPPAQRWCGEGARRFPADARFVSCELWLMATPAVPADPARAWALLARLDSLAAGPDGAWSRLQHRLVVGGVLARAGLADSARAVLAATRAAATAAVDPRQDLLPVEAYMRSLLRDYDVAIDLLKRYSAANPGHFDAATFGTAWWWRELRAQPRFRELTGTS